MRRRLSLLLITAVSLLALTAAPASADDASLERAGKSRDEKIKRLEPRFDRAARTFRRSNFQRTGPIIRVLRRLRSEFRLVAGRVRRQQPSTSGGATYKRLQLRALRTGSRAIELQILAVRVAKRGRLRRSRQLARRGDRLSARAARQERAGIRALEEAKKSPQPSPSPSPSPGPSPSPSPPPDDGGLFPGFPGPIL